MTLERDPNKLRDNRIEQLKEFALESLHERGVPPFFATFIDFVYKEARSRFFVSESTARDYAENAALAALRTYQMEIE